MRNSEITKKNFLDTKNKSSIMPLGYMVAGNTADILKNKKGGIYR